jgi:hypothetical protein
MVSGSFDTTVMEQLLADLRVRQHPVDAKLGTVFQTLASLAFSYASSVLRQRVTTASQRDYFVEKFIGAWSEMLANLARWEEFNLALNLLEGERLLLAGWHFPELPRLFSFARQTKVLLLVSQDAPWLENLRAKGCTLNFRDENSYRKLVKEMKMGRVVGTMMDHIYPDTRAIFVPLFGHSAKTASSILELCIANRYTVAFIGPRGDGIEIIDSIEASRHADDELAIWINKCLEAEVKRAPERWLMWPSLGFRLKASVVKRA